MKFSFGNGLLRAAVSLGFLLGFLGSLVAQEARYSQAATSEPLIVTSEAVMGAFGAAPSFCVSRFANLTNADGSDSMLTDQMEIVLSDDDVAFEDSVEMLRVDTQQRTFGSDQVVIGPKVSSKAARIARPNISPPLLV